MPCFDIGGTHPPYPLKEEALCAHYPIFFCKGGMGTGVGLCLFPTCFRRGNILG